MISTNIQEQRSGKRIMDQGQQYFVKFIYVMTRVFTSRWRTDYRLMFSCVSWRRFPPTIAYIYTSLWVFLGLCFYFVEVFISLPSPSRCMASQYCSYQAPLDMIIRALFFQCDRWSLIMQVKEWQSWRENIAKHHNFELASWWSSSSIGVVDACTLFSLLS